MDDSNAARGKEVTQTDAVERIERTLKEAGYLIYPPGKHPGECKRAYIVVRRQGTYGTVASMRVGYTLIDVNCYVPLDGYDELAPMVKAVKAALNGIRSQARRTGHETPDNIEESYKAHTRAIEYQVLKRL